MKYTKLMYNTEMNKLFLAVDAPDGAYGGNSFVFDVPVSSVDGILSMFLNVDISSIPTGLFLRIILRECELVKDNEKA